jgi:hypothetical protein
MDRRARQVLIDRLQIRLFAKDEICRYFDVPQRTYHQLLQAESKGAYLNLNIRKSFSFKRITQTSSATY